MPKRRNILVVSDQQLITEFKCLFRYGFNVFFLPPKEAFSFFLNSEIDFVFVFTDNEGIEREKIERVLHDIEFFAGEDVKIFCLGFMENGKGIKEDYIQLPLDSQKLLDIVKC